jgi:hypothetical protein
MKTTFLLTILAASVLPMRAAAQEPKTSVREGVALAGTVERVDRVSRLLTLKGDDTRTHSVYVPPDVTLFDDLKAGDRVIGRVRESIVVSTRPGLRPRPLTDTTAQAANTARGPEDPKVTQQLTAVVTIESIDRKTQSVIYKTADNRRIVRAVADAQLLDGLKPGDVVEVTLTRERVIELQRR